MGLFDQILGAIENPEQQGSIGRLGDIVNTVEQLSQNIGTEPLHFYLTKTDNLSVKLAGGSFPRQTSHFEAVDLLCC
ncbi:MAG: hypothetical protein PUP91_22260 [Rhizonema sp. PD37]|nr:hypothetical protein [Rhizonema sp. PD37]